jgi:hypothetical protein
MSPTKVRFAVMLDPEQLTQLKEIESATGATVSEQIRRAIVVYVQTDAIAMGVLGGPAAAEPDAGPAVPRKTGLKMAKVRKGRS